MKQIEGKTFRCAFEKKRTHNKSKFPFFNKSFVEFFKTYIEYEEIMLKLTSTQKSMQEFERKQKKILDNLKQSLKTARNCNTRMSKNLTKIQIPAIFYTALS